MKKKQLFTLIISFVLSLSFVLYAAQEDEVEIAEKWIEDFLKGWTSQNEDTILKICKKKSEGGDLFIKGALPVLDDERICLPSLNLMKSDNNDIRSLAIGFLGLCAVEKGAVPLINHVKEMLKKKPRWRYKNDVYYSIWALSRIKNKASLDFLSEYVIQSDDIDINAVEALCKMKRFDPLINLIKKGKSYSWWIQSFIDHANSSAEEGLLEILNESVSKSTISSAVSALGRIKSYNAIPKVEHLLEQDSIYEYSFFEFYAELGDKKFASGLIQRFGNNSDVQKYLLECLGSLKDPDSISFIFDRLKSEDREVKEAAFHSLWKFKEILKLEQVVPLLNDENTKNYALLLLGRLNDTKAINHILPHIKDVKTRFYALKGIRSLANKEVLDYILENFRAEEISYQMLFSDIIAAAEIFKDLEDNRILKVLIIYKDKIFKELGIVRLSDFGIREISLRFFHIFGHFAGDKLINELKKDLNIENHHPQHSLIVKYIYLPALISVKKTDKVINFLKSLTKEFKKTEGFASSFSPYRLFRNFGAVDKKKTLEFLLNELIEIPLDKFQEQKEILISLGDLGDKKASNELRPYLKGIYHPLVKATAALALAKLNDKRSLNQIKFMKHYFNNLREFERMEYLPELDSLLTLAEIHLDIEDKTELISKISEYLLNDNSEQKHFGLMISDELIKQKKYKNEILKILDDFIDKEVESGGADIAIGLKLQLLKEKRVTNSLESIENGKKGFFWYFAVLLVILIVLVVFIFTFRYKHRK